MVVHFDHQAALDVADLCRVEQVEQSDWQSGISNGIQQWEYWGIIHEYAILVLESQMVWVQMQNERYSRRRAAGRSALAEPVEVVDGHGGLQ